ncbi:Outer-membrane lipoprotein LolB [Candidatus Hartigia pinicola]|nr:Outer-membrane lipoprotein LolB [Candidatus Hartigia pinicola]
MQISTIFSSYYSLITRTFWFLFLVSCLLLTNCVKNEYKKSSTELISDPQWETHQAKLNTLHEYQIRGSCMYQEDQKKIYANFFWHQYSLKKYRLLIINPLGIKELEIIVRPNISCLKTKTGQKHISHLSSDLMHQFTGMIIPLDDLTAWLIGSPGRAREFELDKNHLLKSVTFENNSGKWQLSYLSYNKNTIPILPKSLELYQGIRLIKIKIDNWTLKR